MLLVASVVNLSGVTVTAPANPDANLISRTVLSDGTMGECRRMTEDRPGWLSIQCESSPFIGQTVYRPMAARIEAAWTSPRPIGAPDHGSDFVLWPARDAGR
jgi:hypothetical protein